MYKTRNMYKMIVDGARFIHFTIEKTDKRGTTSYRYTHRISHSLKRGQDGKSPVSVYTFYYREKGLTETPPLSSWARCKTLCYFNI